MIARDALRSLGCDVYADPRRSLFLRHNGSAYKITGSAIRETLTHGLLHGTVLVHADLAVLNEALRAHDPHVHVNGIPSVPSPVTNLPKVTIDAVQATVHEHFAAHMKREGVVMYRTAHADDYAHQLRPRLDTQRSWEWNYSRTPHFSYRDGTVSAEIRHGIITDSSVASIVGKQYSPRLMAGPLAPDKRPAIKRRLQQDSIGLRQHVGQGTEEFRTRTAVDSLVVNSQVQGQLDYFLNLTLTV